MTDSAPHLNLSGKLLIAMPGMGDPRFVHTVIFICAHSGEGAMGLIVNRPAEDLNPGDLLEQLDIETEGDGMPGRIHIGGPVASERGFVLHSGEYVITESTLRVSEEFGMTATREILEDMASGRGPARALLALGYAGWAPGQLEAEIGQNGWLNCDASPDLVFSPADSRKWERALATLGIDPLALSASAGRA